VLIRSAFLKFLMRGQSALAAGVIFLLLKGFHFIVTMSPGRIVWLLTFSGHAEVICVGATRNESDSCSRCRVMLILQEARLVFPVASWVGAFFLRGKSVNLGFTDSEGVVR
jgi:hypothetical protein